MIENKVKLLAVSQSPFFVYNSRILQHRCIVSVSFVSKLSTAEDEVWWPLNMTLIMTCSFSVKKNQIKKVKTKNMASI